jgi:carbamoyltransferase
MIILGLAGGLGHDASAALVIDGQLVSLAEEERFARSRQARGHLPVESAAHCLAAAGLTMSDVDVIATSLLHPDRDAAWRDLEQDLLDHPYFAGHTRPRVARVRHPLAHAAASYYTSGLDAATVISIDGCGDAVSTVIGHARGRTITVSRDFPIDDSLGLFYLGLTNYLGFRFGQEGKVMGLASYADPDENWMPFTLDDDGYRSGLSSADRDRPNFGPPVVRAWKARMTERFGPPQPVDFVYSRSTARLHPHPAPNMWRQRVAATGQHVLERVLLHLVEVAVRETGCRDVVIGGGVGYNCTGNGAVWRSGLVDRLAVFPASGDAGTSAGAALAVAAAEGEPASPALTSADLGPGFRDDEIRATLHRYGVPFTEEDDIAATTADLITEGRVVGWFQGRAECGPRALGARSILASPLTRAMHERVNTVKNREQWRPLAPSMSHRAAARYLVDPGPVRFMLSACQVSESTRVQVPAVVHVDGSCRPQVLGEDSSLPHYRALLGHLARRGHPEIVLNTSFNLDGEPIVHSPFDAVRSFYGSGLDALAIGPLLVRKPLR